MNKKRIGSLYEFKDVDHAINPLSYIDYLDQSNTHNSMIMAKERVASLLQPKHGHVLLDIGCGVGHDAQMLASLVGRSGSVVGIDKSKLMVQEAKRRFRRTTLPVKFYCRDAQKLEFAADTFDGSVCFSVLTHCPQPSAVISEALRVLKPGGQLVVSEPDWDSLVINMGERHSEELLTAILRKSVYHSGIAHRLPRLFMQYGFHSIKADAVPLTISNYTLAKQAWRIESAIARACAIGTLSTTDATHLLSELRKHPHHFFGAFLVFVVIGTKEQVSVRGNKRKQKNYVSHHQPNPTN